MAELAPKSCYKNFVVTKYLLIEEIRCTLLELIHQPTGARIIHIVNDDDENLFSLLFPTIPTCGDGVAHILEHIVLCGSKKYPVKDPFFSMNRRSLHTYMNALTGADFTCYPASSQVEKDFYNLLDVYMDAVFYPLLTKESFLQEGHRLEFSTKEDPNSPLLIKGIVFNEMKGAMASIDARMWQAIFENIVPDLPYAHNSGGDPLEIPQLSYERLKEFHATHYHPSQCTFFFYGNIPTKKHLDFLEKKVLKGCSKKLANFSIGEQPRFSHPKKAQAFYPASLEEERKKEELLCLSFLTVKASDVDDLLALTLLDQILMGTDGSLLKKVLLESDLCPKCDSYLDTEMSEVPWVIVCKKIQKENVEKVEKLIFSTLKEIAKKEISPDLISSALHQLEFSRTEIGCDSYPYGLSLFFRSALSLQYGTKPEDALMIHSLIDGIEKKCKDPKYLSNFINNYLLSNPHHVTLSMQPSASLLDKEKALEKKRVESIQKNLSEEQKIEIVEQAKKLYAYQTTLEEQSLSCLPKIQIEDVSKKIRDFSLEHTKVDNMDVFFHDVFTNQILYVDLFFDLPFIEKEDLSYVSLFTHLLTDLGCNGLSYDQALQYQEAYIGDISTEISLHINTDNPEKCSPSFHLKAKALNKNADKLFWLCRGYLCSASLDDKKRITQLVLQLHAYLENSLNKNAMQYAITSSLHNLTTSSSIYNQWHGVPFFQLVRKIAQNLEKEIPILLEKFYTFQKSILNIDQLHLVLGCDAAQFSHIKKENFFGLHQLKAAPSIPWKNDYTFSKEKSHAYVLPISVAFTSLAYQTVGFTDPLSPYLLIATYVMENTILHNKIREIGGAYGSGATYSPTSGQFYFYGYRDPHIHSTITTFHEAIEQVAKGKFNKQDLEEAKLGVIQAIDMPISPSLRAATAYTWYRTHKTAKKRQAYRDKILEATKADIQKAVETLLLPQKLEGKFVTFCSDNLYMQDLGKDFPKHIL